MFSLGHPSKRSVFPSTLVSFGEGGVAWFGFLGESWEEKQGEKNIVLHYSRKREEKRFNCKNTFFVAGGGSLQKHFAVRPWPQNVLKPDGSG